MKRSCAHVLVTFTQKNASMQARALVRLVAVLFLTALALVEGGTDILLPWNASPEYGFSSSPSGAVTAVDATAGKAGLRVGDVIDITRLTPEQRTSFGAVTVARDPFVALPLLNGRTIVLPRHTNPRSTADNVTDVIAVLAGAIYIALAGALLLWRPSPVTWAFFIFAFDFSLGGTLWIAYLPFWTLVFVFVVISAAFPAAAAAFFSFALRFPDVRPRGMAAMAERAVLFVVGPAAIACFEAAYIANVFYAITLPPWMLELCNVFVCVTYAAGIAALLSRFTTADPVTRNKLRWVVAAFSVAFLPVLGEILLENVRHIHIEVTYINLFETFQLLAPLALAYTIFKHRLFDVRFVVSRALLYASLTSIVVALLAVVDWAFGRWLAETRFALVAELLIAVSIGIAIAGIHRKIEHFLNAVIFRAQVRAMQSLRRFAHETDLISDPHHLLLQTYEALRTRLESEYYAVYTLDGSSYAIATPDAKHLPALVAGHDLAVLRLRRWQEPFECDEPGHSFLGALMLPMTARGALIGYIVCGPKKDGTHYLPDEVETLSFVTHRTASAYALLTLARTNATLPRPAESPPA